MVKTMLALALTLSTFVVAAKTCAYETKKGPCAESAVAGADYCREHFVKAAADKVRARQLKLNEQADLKSCSKLDKAGQPCIHKAPAGKDTCLVHDAREAARAELKALEKAARKAAKDAAGEKKKGEEKGKKDAKEKKPKKDKKSNAK